MDVKHLLVLLELACLLSGGVASSQVTPEGVHREVDFAVDEWMDASEFPRGLSAGPEKLGIDVFEIGRNELEEESEKEEKLFGSEVDEETIRKAEKMADKDLLNGLNRILKNNETLKDVFWTENVYQIP